MKTLCEDRRVNRDPLFRVALTAYRYGRWAEDSRLRLPLVLWPYGSFTCCWCKRSSTARFTVMPPSALDLNFITAAGAWRTTR